MKLYHFIPEEMQGTILYPLNEMGRKFPKLFARQQTKYKGRAAVQETEIPGLGKWNDVIHLSPINPHDLIAELKKASAPAGFQWRAYVIDADSLDPANAVIMIPTKRRGEFERIFIPFTKENLAKHSAMPEENKQYFRDEVAAGRTPLNYAFTPHVLYKGTIETKNLPIIHS